MHVADHITAVMKQSQSIACVGLDPRPQLIPPALRQQMQQQHNDPHDALCAAFLEFNQHILRAIAGQCAAIKPQVACYEAYGWRGMKVLEESIACAHSLKLPIIVDGKRNDIGSTATHYQQAWLGNPSDLEEHTLAAPGCDWLTVNGYLGRDGILPFLDNDNSHGIFVLVKTSNPSSADLQSQASGDTTVMEAMARLVHDWGRGRLGHCGLSAVGAVVGATWPEEARQLRQLMPDTLFLVPGYGAQGGSAADALAGARNDGQGILINSSRQIIGAWQQDHTADWAAAARAALDAMNHDLNSHR